MMYWKVQVCNLFSPGWLKRIGVKIIRGNSWEARMFHFFIFFFFSLIFWSSKHRQPCKKFHALLREQTLSCGGTSKLMQQKSFKLRPGWVTSNNINNWSGLKALLFFGGTWRHLRCGTEIKFLSIFAQRQRTEGNESCWQANNCEQRACTFLEEFVGLCGTTQGKNSLHMQSQHEVNLFAHKNGFNFLFSEFVSHSALLLHCRINLIFFCK